MNIAFYAGISDLANNGGTNTIIRSAAALRERGHRMDIVTSVDQFTRMPHPPCIDAVPLDTDVVCAVSYMDVEAMHQIKIGRKYWWMRLWDKDDGTMRRLASMQPTATNASWIQRKLGNKIQHIPQGTDIDFWFDIKQIRTGVGVCARSEKRKRFDDIYSASYITSIIEHAYPEEMRNWYSSLLYFLAPAELEGLPNTPIEATLCGASLICRRNEEAGCEDFSDGAALMYDDIDEIPVLLANDTQEKRDARVAEAVKRVHERIGTREQCAEALERFFQT